MQGLGEHFLADPVHPPPQCIEPVGAIASTTLVEALQLAIRPCRGVPLCTLILLRWPPDQSPAESASDEKGAQRRTEVRHEGSSADAGPVALGLASAGCGGFQRTVVSGTTRRAARCARERAAKVFKGGR